MRLGSFLSVLMPISTLALLTPASGEDAKQVVNLSITPVREWVLGDYPNHANHLCREQEAVFIRDSLSYAITYQGCVDKAHGGKVAPLEGYIGMPQPARCNWYHSGFLFILLNGQDIGTTPISSMMVTEPLTSSGGRRGILDMVWHHQLADVRVRFLALAERDNLYCQIAIEPKQQLNSIELVLRCYPSFFTAWYKRDGARRIQTPATLVEQGKTVTLPAKDNWVAVYYDEIFDLAKGEGEGPCALLLLPNEASKITFAPDSYAVDTRITYPPQTSRIHLAFWDFQGKTNAEALTRMQQLRGAVRDELAKLNFTPEAVLNFDIAAMRALVERALKSEAVRAVLGDKVTEIQAWLDRYGPALERKGAPTIDAEEELLQAIDRYQNFIWEVKLAELIADL